jgi:glycolate oxidase FAD binding subunit
MELVDIQNIIKNNDKVIIGDNLKIIEYSGIVSYYPDELVISVKSGTLVKDINAALKQHNQALDFIADENKTIGSIFANGGHSVRMSVLGVEIVDGRGDILEFGGEVMKNVAGYDISRMLCGSKGRCGIITQISFKILPQYLAGKHQDNYIQNNTIQQLREKIYLVFDPEGKFNAN